jgi:hypothetical protein
MKGDASQAEKYITEALVIRRKALPPGHHGIVAIEAELGKTRSLQRRFSEAEHLLAPSYETLRATMGEKHQTTMTALRYLAELYRDWGKREKAIEYEKKLAAAQ